MAITPYPPTFFQHSYFTNLIHYTLFSFTFCSNPNKALPLQSEKIMR